MGITEIKSYFVIEFKFNELKLKTNFLFFICFYVMFIKGMIIYKLKFILKYHISENISDFQTYNFNDFI